MILVMLGTQNNNFYRLLDEVENNIENGTITEEVVVQSGYTKYKSTKMQIFSMTSKENLEKLVQKANFIITHAGVGSIEMALKENKKVIAVPRSKEFREHVNNHQKEIASDFNKKGLIIGIDDVSELNTALKKINRFIPNKLEYDNSKRMMNIIKTYIDKL